MEREMRLLKDAGERKRKGREEENRWQREKDEERNRNCGEMREKDCKAIFLLFMSKDKRERLRKTHREREKMNTRTIFSLPK